MIKRIAMIKIYTFIFDINNANKNSNKRKRSEGNLIFLPSLINEKKKKRIQDFPFVVKSPKSDFTNIQSSALS